MKADRSQWRTDSAYDYMDALGTEGLAWECLRRNGRYQKDFARYLRATGGKADIEGAIAARWGLRFRGAPEPNQPRAACPLDAQGQSGRHPSHAAA